MKSWIKKFMALVVVGSVILSASGELCEAKTLSPELVEILWPGEDVIFYDCGTSTEDGLVQIISKSNSLQEGDIVEIEVLYNAEKNQEGGMSSIGWLLEYDKDVLEVMTTKGPEDISNFDEIHYYPAKEGTVDEWEVWFDVFHPVYVNVCVAKISFVVKKNASSTKLYLWGCSLDAVNATGVVLPIMYYEEFSHPYEYDVLTLNIEDSGNQSSTGNSFALSATSKEASAGSDITVPLNITSNPGINALGITVTYDQDMCDYKDLVITDEFKNLISLDSVYKVPGEGTVKLSFIAKDNITDTGTFANLSLKLKEGVADETSSNVAVAIEQVTNKELTTVTGTGASAKITVKAASQEVCTLGDVNEDGRIDLTDAIYILLSYNEEKVLTDAQKKAADINKDNAVDLMDALQILKYFNGEIKAL